MDNLVDFTLSLGGELADDNARQIDVPETHEERMRRLAGVLHRTAFPQEHNYSAVRVPPARATARTDGTQADGTGLSSCHISPQVIAYKGASYFKVQTGKQKAKQIETERDDEKGQKTIKRGRVTEFTKKSRLRMMRELSKVCKDAEAIFVTLTYPGEYPEDEKTWKRHLDNFIKRMGRKFSIPAGVWKMEPQKRGAPHFHLLVYNVEYVDLLCFVGRAWYEVVGSNDPKHLQAGTRVEQIHSAKGVMFYASKYLGKDVSADWEHSGRWWGVFGRDNLPVGEVVNIPITEKQAFTIIRYMRRFGRIRPRAFKSLTINCDADQWVKMNRLE